MGKKFLFFVKLFCSEHYNLEIYFKFTITKNLFQIHKNDILKSISNSRKQYLENYFKFTRTKNLKSFVDLRK